MRRLSARVDAITSRARRVAQRCVMCAAVIGAEIVIARSTAARPAPRVILESELFSVACQF
jgi:hypothetical protein